MQADSVDMSQTSGPQLHVKAVVEGFKRRGHLVRTVAIQQERTATVWSDDLVQWHPAVFGPSMSPWFRAPESALRAIQSRLRLPFLRLFDSYRFSDACVSALAGYDVLYERFGLLSYGGLIAAKRLRLPLVYELNGDLVEEYRQLGIRLSTAQWAVIHFATSRMLAQADHVVTVSEPLRERVIRRWQVNPARVTCVANGADIELFAGAQVPEESRQPGLHNDESWIVFVGGFQPWHGIDLLVDAFNIVAQGKEGAKLVLIGDGPARPATEKQVTSLNLSDRVFFTGNIAHADVAALLKKSQVAVLNPRASAMARSLCPLKLFEYMAAGKAIVAPAIPEIAQYVTHTLNALLVPPDDELALAEALLQLLSDERLRTELGSNAKQQAVDRHSWAHTVAELESIMHALL